MIIPKMNWLCQSYLGFYCIFSKQFILEMSRHGEVDELIICDNLGDHIVGNVYVKFT